LLNPCGTVAVSQRHLDLQDDRMASPLGNLTSPLQTEALIRHVSEPLAEQLIAGRVKLRIWGQSLDATHPATWALALRLVSRDGTQERGVLLPLTTGSTTQKFGTELAPMLIGPLRLNPMKTVRGDRLVAEIGALGQARIEPRDDNQAWIRLFTNADLCFEDFATHLGDHKTSREINQCIYCGANGPSLSREHVIPKGLKGNLTLVAGSCSDCRDITSAFELDVLRYAVGALRQAFKMRSKTSKSPLRMQVRRGGIQVEIQVPANEYPTVLALPVFAPPGHCVGRPDSEDLTIEGVRLTQLAGLPWPALQQKYGIDADYLGVTIRNHPFFFSRTLAKIAYGFAVLKLGLPNIADRYVLPTILGAEKHIGRWVGCDQTQPSKPSTGLHEIRIDLQGREIHVFVRLFAQFGAPEYHIVVGRVPA
jgi:hypothetical protein